MDSRTGFRVRLCVVGSALAMGAWSASFAADPPLTPEQNMARMERERVEAEQKLAEQRKANAGKLTMTPGAIDPNAKPGPAAPGNKDTRSPAEQRAAYDLAGAAAAQRPPGQSVAAQQPYAEWIWAAFGAVFLLAIVHFLIWRFTGRGLIARLSGTAGKG